MAISQPQVLIISLTYGQAIDEGMTHPCCLWVCLLLSLLLNRQTFPYWLVYMGIQMILNVLLGE